MRDLRTECRVISILHILNIPNLGQSTASFRSGRFTPVHIQHGILDLERLQRGMDFSSRLTTEHLLEKL